MPPMNVAGGGPTSAAPPLPPGMGGAAAAAPQQPDMMMLAGMQGNQVQQQGGMSQISESAVRMGAEIDQALKLLAQAIPNLAPWVEKTVLELRFQLGNALQSGAVPTNPAPSDNQSFPDGGGRL